MVIIVMCTHARAIVLTLEDLPGDIHEGSSVASEYDLYMNLKVSGFGASKVTINETINGRTAYSILVLDGPVNPSKIAVTGDAMTLADPLEIQWKDNFVGPQSVTMTFQAVDESGNKSAVLTRKFTVRGIGVPPPNPTAKIDRHPEQKSRAVAWTEFDGSYRFDKSSRAEMLDVFWNVFNKTNGDHGWTGSVNPPVAGGTSELWRVREYAQLNAYRWLNGSDPVNEDPEKLDFVQSAALVFAQNPASEITHRIPTTYVGYNTTAALAAVSSLLAGTADDTDFVASNGYRLNGTVDVFISDEESTNSAVVGHRYNLLHNNSTLASAGSALWYPDLTPKGFADVWNSPFVHDIDASRDRFIAYPSPGFFPIPLITPHSYFSWSFVTANDLTCTQAAKVGLRTVAGVPLKDSYVTAKIDGVPASVIMVGYGTAPAPLTWNFGSALDFDNGAVADGTNVEITVHDVAICDDLLTVTGYRDYQYTVTLFDPQKIVSTGYSPKTPLTNISTRSVIGGGDQQMIAGFTVTGSEPVRVAVRTQGPGLKQYGISNAANSTHIRVYDQASGSLMGENTGWKTHPNWRLLQSLGVAPSQDNEAAEVLTLWPGSYTAVVSDATGNGGVGIVEAFDIDNLSATKLVNLSTRGVVGKDENQMIAGISISGSARTVVIRTQGPGLTRFGVSGAVSDTVLKIVAQSDGHTVATNDDWQTDAANARLSGDLATYAPSDPREAALVVTLQPGAYTALVSAKDTAGVGIVEVFDVTPP